jgi:hypothetical protein
VDGAVAGVVEAASNRMSCAKIIECMVEEAVRRGEAWLLAAMALADREEGERKTHQAPRFFLSPSSRTHHPLSNSFPHSFRPDVVRSTK